MQTTYSGHVDKATPILVVHIHHPCLKLQRAILQTFISVRLADRSSTIGQFATLFVVMGNPVWDCGPVWAVAVHIVAETVTQPYFRFCCLQFHHSFNDNVL